MSEIQCFLLVEANLSEVSLRRYHSSGDENKCPGRYGYHNGHFYLPNDATDPKCSDEPGSNGYPDKNDPRWPKKCDYCDYMFVEADCWQVFKRGLYRRSDNGELTTLQDSPPGAMWWAPWYADMVHRTSPRHLASGGGPHLIVKTPDGDWDTDSIASNGPGWDRSGEPPNITANPSIICGTYHGWLRDGKLIEV